MCACKVAKAAFSVSEAAQYLGISESWVYKAARRGVIPSVKIGGKVMLPIAAIERLLNVEVA